MNEERFAKEMNKIQSVVSRALQKANTLAALADGGKMSREKLQLTLEETAYFFESATLHLRSLCETQMPGIGGYAGAKGWSSSFRPDTSRSRAQAGCICRSIRSCRTAGICPRPG